MAEVLIIGRTSPPVGGVTTHVGRLTEALRQNHFDFSFCDLNNEKLPGIIYRVLKHPIIHIHFSKPLYQILAAIFCRFTGKKLIITYHGCWGRYGPLGNVMVKASARLAAVPVVQEHAGLRQALGCNPRSRLISTYSPGPPIEPLIATTHSEIVAIRKSYQATFCTNAWDLTFDRYGREIYGISELVSRFADYPEYLLLVSDPSGNYRSYIERCFLHIPENIFFINRLHDFRSVLLLSDAFIRNTTTDGVSLSIHEARESGVAVIASDAAERPSFCSIFRDIAKADLKEKLKEAKRHIALPGEPANAAGKLISVYRELGSRTITSS